MITCIHKLCCLDREFRKEHKQLLHQMQNNKTTNETNHCPFTEIRFLNQDLDRGNAIDTGQLIKLVH